KRRKGVEKAGCETPETAIAEAGIFFLRGNLIEIVAERLQRLAYFFQQSIVERGKRIDETATEQELHRQVADALDVCARDAIGRRDPALCKLFTNRNRERVVEVAARRSRHGLAERALQSIDNRIA